MRSLVYPFGMPPLLTQEWKEYFERLSMENLKLQQAQKDYATSELNKIIFIIGTGTFVLSISFIGYLKTSPEHPWLLIASWIFLVLAIAGNVLAHSFSAKVAERKIEHLNTSRISGFMPHWETLTESDKDIMWWRKYGAFITVFVWFSLAGGLLALLLFGGSNLLAQNAIKEAGINSHHHHENWHD